MEPIDIVLPWVDDTDPHWIAEREQYMQEFHENRNNLSHYFRDWDTLRYVFRGIEKNMSWVRHVHFITCGHLPLWLNLNHPKLKIHYHKNFFSKESALPVFSSHPIEMNLRNIPGLAEKFIYFNDDTLVMRPVLQNRFFRDNLPVDYLVLDIPRGGWLYEKIRIKDSYASICRNSINMLNRLYPLKELRKTNPDLFFHPTYKLTYKLRNFLLSLIGVYSWIKVNHHPQGFLLSNLNKCYDLFSDAIDNTSRNRFRSYDDVNQYLYRNYALMTGQFSPCYYNDAFCIVLASLDRYMKERGAFLSKTFVCVNDSPFLKESEYTSLKVEVDRDLTKAFPVKSTFEK